MKVAVIGDLLLDLEGHGMLNGDCVENPRVPLFRGSHVQVFAGGAGSLANLLTSQRATVDLFCSGPGDKSEAWIADLARKVLRVNRVCFSGYGSIPLKIRGIGPDGKVAARIDCEEKSVYTGPFVALEGLLDDCKRGKYDAVVVSDYCKGVVCQHTEQVISDILKAVRFSAVDTKRKTDYFLWKHSSCITPNQKEAWDIYGTDDPCVIRDMVGCDCVYVTRGANSVLMGCGAGATEIAVSECVENPYIIGAGDSFVAGVITSLAQGRSYIEAGMAGVKLAQSYVSKGRKSVLR